MKPAWASLEECEKIVREGWREEAITKLHPKPITANSKLEESKLQDEIDGLLAKEEVFWKQRGKVHWLREGNRKTSYFHNQASIRRTMNAISRIKDRVGQLLVEAEDIQGQIEKHTLETFFDLGILQMKSYNKGQRRSQLGSLNRSCMRSSSRTLQKKSPKPSHK
ncbi:UNVERIFIED_CONTAM: hypothetical protein Sradi_6831600 [Sesamum radiatum]|uniref:Uncharacterized protein n=1 Tax=Sesamum radiatum TaxID=300843 RepID=A0AAW2JTL1_SESRA